MTHAAIVTEAYGDFSSEAGAAVEQFFVAGWIDAPVRPDKRHGAYCATNVPGVHPYVFMNYTGDRRSILTLAHELGHALHGTMAQPLGLFNASTPLTTAETASVFGEALTFKRLLAVRGRPTQAARPAHRAARGRDRDDVPPDRDEPLRDISSTPSGASRGSCRPNVSTSCGSNARPSCSAIRSAIGGYDTWWSYIPHFTNTPGYVYAYAYGYLFALAIFRSYGREGDAIVAPYLELLRAGGSKPPEELARMVGLDLTDPSIWASGIEALSDDLDEAEALATEIGLGSSQQMGGPGV